MRCCPPLIAFEVLWSPQALSSRSQQWYSTVTDRQTFPGFAGSLVRSPFGLSPFRLSGLYHTQIFKVFVLVTLSLKQIG
jgi:hypothetical protein